MPTSSTPVILDCDNTMGLPGQEIDDGLTLLYLLGRPSLRVVGVCTTHGNGSVTAVTGQTRALLATLGVDLPLHRGADPPVGTSGGSWRSRSEAAAALVQASKEHEGRLFVLALGANTNLAGAAELDPDFFSRLAGIVLMGGYLGPLRFGRREIAELNLSSDPEAAHSVLSAPCPVTIMSAQLCLGARYGVRHLIFHNRGPAWLRRLVREWYAAFSGWAGSRGFYLWDLVPAVSLVEPDRFPAVWWVVRSTVDDLKTGRLVLDPTDRAPAEAGVVCVPQTIVRARALPAECAAV